MIKIKPTQQKRIPSRKRIILILVSIFLIGFISACFVAKIGYEICFQRAEIPSQLIYLRYQDVDQQKYPRSPVEFVSGNNSLKGYLYGEDSEKGLVVISHGLGAGAESYLSETLFFIDKGWRVFTYNNTGTHTSEGESTKGISQSVLDLKAALDYISSKPSLSNLPVVLYGHSWGGYAVTSILTYNYPISAVASVAGFSSPKEALYDFAEGKTSVFGVIGFPFFLGYHNIFFEENANISAIYANTRITDWETLQKKYKGNVPAEIQRIYDAETDKFFTSELDIALFESINQIFEKSIAT